MSGRGSNMEALVRADIPAQIAGVISNRADAPGLRFASNSRIATSIVDDRDFSTREAFESALSSAVDEHSPAAVALAGFMRILSDAFVERYRGRLLNIHPSLLPAFPGVHTHRRALEEGVKLHGCTVHFVTRRLDRGPIIIQAVVPVRGGDSEATLAARVLRQEHRIYPLAVRWLIEDRLVIENGIVRVSGEYVSQALFAEE